MNGETQQHDAAPIPAGPMDELKAAMGEMLVEMLDAADGRADVVRAAAVARIAVDIWAARNVHEGEPLHYVDDALALLEAAETAIHTGR